MRDIGAVEAAGRGSLPLYQWYTEDVSAPEAAARTRERHLTDAPQEVATSTFTLETRELTFSKQRKIVEMRT